MNTQKILITILALIIIVLAFLFSRANSKQQDSIELLLATQDSVKHLRNEVAFNELKNEVLKEINSNLSSELYTKTYNHVNPKTETLSQEAREVQKMIQTMEKGWEKMMEIQNPDELLKFFLPQYTTNSVKINTQNMPFVQRHNNTDFRTHLQHLAQTKQLTFSFDQPKFYTTMVKGNVFTTNYLSHLTAMHEGQIVHKSTILCFVSGQRQNGQWLIGNYNWTRYDEFDASKNHAQLML
jgi:hypothetical protein